MVIFTKKFRTLDPHLPIVWDKVLKKTVFFFYTFPKLNKQSWDSRSAQRDRDVVDDMQYCPKP